MGINGISSGNINSNKIEAINNNKTEMNIANQFDNYNAPPQTITFELIPSDSEVDSIYEELENKEIVSQRQAEGEELALFSEETTYSDGTVRKTGINQSFWPGSKDIIEKPSADGNSIETKITFENREDGMVLLTQTSTGSSDNSQTTDIIKVFEGREDHKVREIANPSNEEYTLRVEYSGREDGVVAIEQSADKTITYYIDGTQKVVQ